MSKTQLSPRKVTKVTGDLVSYMTRPCAGCKQAGCSPLHGRFSDRCDAAKALKKLRFLSLVALYEARKEIA